MIANRRDLRKNYCRRHECYVPYVFVDPPPRTTKYLARLYCRLRRDSPSEHTHSTRVCYANYVPERNAFPPLPNLPLHKSKSTSPKTGYQNTHNRGRPPAYRRICRRIGELSLNIVCIIRVQIAPVTLTVYVQWPNGGRCHSDRSYLFERAHATVYNHQVH